MIKSIYFILSRGSSIDSRDNALTIYSVVEEIGAPKLPVTIPDLSLSGSYLLENEENHNFRANILVLNNDKEIFKEGLECGIEINRKSAT